MTLAIEHTIVEPFIGEISDYVEFQSVFLDIEADAALVVPSRWVQVFVQVGSLSQKPQSVRKAIVDSVRQWISENRTNLELGESYHQCPIERSGGGPANEILLSTKVLPLKGEGKLHIRRQQIIDDFSKVIDKTLSTKLPKLVNTPADRRILLLERQHMNLLPSRMLAEIEAQRAQHPELEKVDEIWIAETMFWTSERCVFFEHYEAGQPRSQFGFFGTEFFE